MLLIAYLKIKTQKKEKKKKLCTADALFLLTAEENPFWDSYKKTVTMFVVKLWKEAKSKY